MSDSEDYSEDTLKACVIYVEILRHFRLVPVVAQTRVGDLRSVFVKHVGLAKVDNVMNKKVLPYFEKIFSAYNLAKEGKELPKRNFVYCDPALIDDTYLVHKYFASRELCEEFGISETTRLQWKMEAADYINDKTSELRSEAARIKQEAKDKREAAAAKKRESQQKKMAAQKEKAKKKRSSSSVTGKRKTSGTRSKQKAAKKAKPHVEEEEEEEHIAYSSDDEDVV